MTEEELFRQVGIRNLPPAPAARKQRLPGFPWGSALVLLVILVGCLGAQLFATKDPGYLDLAHCTVAPCREFLFGTDSLGRDIFSGIWYGGRISLCIGFLSTLLSTVIALIYGSASALGPGWLDRGLMRFTELFLCIPGLLLVLFFQAILGKASVGSLSLVIGLTGWPTMAKVIRTEVRQLRESGYVVAARAMGGGFFYVLTRHLAPNFLSSILFMVVMNIRGAIVMESTLSFLGMGLPLEVISWGSMLSLSENALTSQAWWVILIPGLFLAATLLCLTELGNYTRRQSTPQDSNL